MLNLEQFYYQKVSTIPPRDRYVTIKEIDDVLVINLDCVYERTCGLRGVDQLLYLTHKLGQNKRFLFISEDGANLALSGAVELITNIVNCFELNVDTCAVVCREDIVIPNATTINIPSIPYWCRVLYPTIQNIPITKGPFDKKFAAWYHRGTFFRLELARYLTDNYRDMSFISYQEHGMITDRKLTEYFTNANWAWKNTPIVYDQLFPNRIFDYEMIVGAERKPYADYFLEIVAETDILTTAWITEKTVKNLYIGKPFVVFSGAGSLAKIRSYGFKTFSPWIDESYDTIDNLYIRLEAIKKEIDRLATVDLQELFNKILPILEHNRQTYETYINSR